MRRIGIHGAGVVSISATGGCPSAPAPWWDPNNEGLCVWSAYQPKGAANFAASLLDLSGNGNNAGDPGGANTPGWAAGTGWQFVSANAEYLTTTYLPGTDQADSIIVQFSNVTNSAALPYLAAKAQGINRDFGLRLLVAAVQYGNGGNVQVAPGLLAGNLAVAGAQGYRNGVADGGAIGAWGVAVAGLGLPIGCAANFAAYLNHLDGYIQALAIYDCTLTAPQVAAIAARMAAL